MAKMKRGDDPSDFKVDEVEEYLESADDGERDRVLQAESTGKHRKSLLEGSGIDFDPDARYDGSGRKLYPWETDPAKAVKATRQSSAVAESGPAQAQSPDSDVAETGETPQPAGTAGDVGTADAPSYGGTGTV